MPEQKQRGGKRPGSGRKPKYKKSRVRSFRIPDELWDEMPDPKSDFVIAAIIEKLSSLKK